MAQEPTGVEEMKFADKFRELALKNRSLLCVGLDSSDYALIIRIIDVTHDLVCAYKPNSAFYEAEGARGIEILKKVCEYIQEKYPEIPIILDAKRGDIGNTNEQYGKFAFEYLKADAITLHPYQGIGALAPFEKYSDKGLFLLCRTSNPESDEYQKEIWQKIARDLAIRDHGRGQWGIVFGATHPNELKTVRQIVGKMIILSPGVGAQGGRVEDVLNEETSRGLDIIINVGRAILQAENPRKVAKMTQKEMEKYVWLE